MSKPLPIFSQMPWNIKEGIIEKLDFYTKRELRVTSKKIRDAVDSCPCKYDLVKIGPITSDTIPMSVKDAFGQFTLRYTTATHGDIISWAIKVLVFIFKNQRTQVKKFILTGVRTARVLIITKTFLSAFHTAMSQFPHKLKLKELNLDTGLSEDDILNVLPLVQPDLEAIEVSLSDGTSLNRVVELDQWQQAQFINLSNLTDATQLRLFNARGNCASRSVLTVEHFKTIIERLLEPTDKLQILLLTDANFNADHITEVISEYNPISNEPSIFFLKRRNESGYVQIKINERQIMFNIYPPFCAALWPVVRE